ncbi:MAG TPA: hypothetical protein VFU15_13290, partial [Bacteroidia bacterium]|nr:hypothetical protein [Bacteroidia bacterium]
MNSFYVCSVINYQSARIQTGNTMKAFQKNLLTTVIALITVFSPAFAQWNTIQHDATVNRGIHDICFVGSTGYAVGLRADSVTFGSRGLVYKTTDGGQTWNMITLPLLIGQDSVMTLNCVQFLTPMKGYAVAQCYTTDHIGGYYYGALLQTVDGGNTWTTNFSTKSLVNYATGYTTNLNHVFFYSNYSAVLCGRKQTSSTNYDGVTFTTSNGGNNWYTSTAFTGIQANASYFFGNATGSVVGGKMQSLAGPYNGKIVLSNDGGSTYATTFTDPGYAYVDIHFPDPQTGYAVGDSMYYTTPGSSKGKIVKTTNGGLSWTSVAVFQNFMPLTVFFTSATTGFVGGETAAGNSGILKTTDGGLTWTPENYPDIATNSYISSITFSTPVTGYASNAWSNSTSVYGNFMQSCGVYTGPDTAFCQLQGQLHATPATPGNNYVFSWSPGTGLSDSTAQNPFVSQVYHQQYVVTMTDTVTSCVAMDTIVVTSYNTINSPVYVCSPDSALLDFGPGATNYFWQFFTDTNNVTHTINQNTETYWATQPGQYAGYAMFTGCGALTSVVQVIDSCASSPSFVCGVNAGPDTTFCQGAGQLHATPASPGNYTFSWSPANGLDDPDSQNPNIIYGVHNQQYVVTMTDTAMNCVAYDTVVVSAYYAYSDTLYACNGNYVTIDLGAGATAYTGQFTDTTGNTTVITPQNEFMTVNQPGEYLIIAYYPGCGSLTSMYWLVDSCNAPIGNVWPGDCNYDLTANMADALQIGLGYNTSGPARPNATNGWYAQPMADWPQNFVNCNYKHADADGNGMIDVNDTLPISLNYGLVHPYRLSQPVVPASSPALQLIANYDTVGLQTLVTVDVVLGTASLPIDSIYGISFRISDDAGLTDTTMTLINLNTTWLGTMNGNTFGFRKYFRAAGALDVAECGNDHLNRINGNGTIAQFFIVTTDNLSGIAVCHFNISDITAVTVSQNYLTLNTVNDSVVIDPAHPAGIAPVKQPVVTAMYPNPANSSVTIQTNVKA